MGKEGRVVKLGGCRVQLQCCRCRRGRAPSSLSNTVKWQPFFLALILHSHATGVKNKEVKWYN